MDEALTWKGLVTIRGRVRDVELKFYPERGCWQLFERTPEKVVRIGVRGIVTEVLSIAAADLLCQATRRPTARPHPFEESFSTRYQTLLKKADRAAADTAVPTFPFTVFALRRGKTGERRWFIRGSMKDLGAWEPYMWKAKLFRALSTAHDQKVKFLKARPECGPVDVVELHVTAGKVAA